LELVFLAELREIDFKVVVRGIDNLIVFIDGCFEGLAANTEINPSEDVVDTFDYVGYEPNNWDLQNEHDSNKCKEDTEPNHMSLSHPILVEVLSIIANSLASNTRLHNLRERE
jgi:transketolase